MPRIVVDDPKHQEGIQAVIDVLRALRVHPSGGTSVPPGLVLAGAADITYITTRDTKAWVCALVNERKTVVRENNGRVVYDYSRVFVALNDQHTQLSIKVTFDNELKVQSADVIVQSQPELGSTFYRMARGFRGAQSAGALSA